MVAMNETVCQSCGALGYTACSQPEDLAALPCHACGIYPEQTTGAVVTEVIGKVINLFEPLR